jgi:hypothetical protein
MSPHQQVKTRRSEIAQMCGGGRGSPVPAVVASLYNQAGGHQNFDQFAVPSDVFPHAMSDLDNAAQGAAAVPPR